MTYETALKEYAVAKVNSLGGFRENHGWHELTQSVNIEDIEIVDISNEGSSGCDTCGDGAYVAYITVYFTKPISTIFRPYHGFGSRKGTDSLISYMSWRYNDVGELIYELLGK